MITLQNFLAPDPAICTESQLYHREAGTVGLSYDSGTYVIPRSSRLSFDTYFNLFNLDSWRHCQLDGLFVELSGQGEVELQITHAAPGHSYEVIHRQVTTLQSDAPYQLDLSHLLETAHGVVFVSLTAIGDRVVLERARFATRSLPERVLPELTVSITTFRREAAVRATVERLEAFLEEFPFADHIRVQVVDNGESANIQPSSHVTPYPNRNLGGAGGFARGLLEAEEAGASHCLFMDDDASFHMENIARTYMVLALARDPKTAIAGAMINSQDKWSLWENGAWFDGVCHPIANGTDLRNHRSLIQMQFDSVAPQPDTLYGGWWFFAFPIAQVRHHPFPFFVRGDDSSFSLANDFTIRTFNGIVSFQDDFSAKETPLIHYLDLRYHLIHHLTFDRLARSPLRTAWVGLRLMIRSLLQLHYASAEAQLLAMKDVMQGPEFFDRNVDMSARRARIKEIPSEETWQPIPQHQLGERHKRLTRLSRNLRTKIGLLTLNGHLVPFWSRIASHVNIEIRQRGLVYYTLGAARVTFFNAARDQAYTVRHNKKRFYKIVWDMIRTTREFCRSHEALKRQYRQGYEDMASRAYWHKTLEMPPKRQAAE